MPFSQHKLNGSHRLSVDNCVTDFNVSFGRLKVLYITEYILVEF